MRLTANQQMSVLASATGLILIAVYFLGLYFGADTARWLPDMIAGIAGFELFMFGQGQWEAFRRRRANGQGGERG
ncbi:hypothetical protein [Croceicoccus gelatinilyticus]|uniref:hypothetical protein n=1 Tax=Croceicoccus gelatinilyticus TaxID=2835536 RepID=UPI001BCD1D41|nr:hypothetical protein [Croceicoccus gelatinilyticus]MBS7668636.1 hypothetical protein [Croceicoccus gelatinilyticus]